MSRGWARRGANAVEFALTLPVLVLILLGTIELSWLLFQDNALDLALREACRRTALEDPEVVTLETALGTYLDAAYESLGLPSCSDCVVTATVSGAAPTRRLACTATRTPPPTTFYVASGDPIGASASAWMEWQSP